MIRLGNAKSRTDFHRTAPIFSVLLPDESSVADIGLDRCIRDERSGRMAGRARARRTGRSVPRFFAK